MGWFYMLANVAALVVLYGVKPGLLFGLALVMLAVSFTTFCLSYDDPLKRARFRVEQQLGRMSSKGAQSEEHQRLQSMKITPNEQDRAFRLTAMSGVNMASGVAGALLLAWGIVARFIL